jgi:hypothetical protein
VSYKLNHETNLFVVAWVDEEHVKDHAIVLMAHPEVSDADLKAIGSWLDRAIQLGASKVVIERHHLDAGIEVNL